MIFSTINLSGNLLICALYVTAYLKTPKFNQLSFPDKDVEALPLSAITDGRFISLFNKKYGSFGAINKYVSE